MQRFIGFALRTSDEFLYEGNRRRPDERGDDHEIVEDIGGRTTIIRHAAPEFSEQKSCRRRFDVETADRVAAPDHILCGSVVQWVPACIVDLVTGMADDGGERITNDGK